MKRLLFSLFLFLPLFCLGQLGVNIHQSNLPFAGVNYEFFDNLRPELRIGIDQYLDNVSFEGAVMYDILNKEDYEWYAGAGVYIMNDFDNNLELSIPVGFNFYPFANKNFGFHLELAPLIAGNYDKLRGSWGIRYRFIQE